MVICVESPGGKKPFSCFITYKIPDLHILEAAQCFPLYYYRKPEREGLMAGGEEWQREWAVTDWILKNIRGRFGNARAITRETIFYYVHGLLHSPEYRARFADDLKKELPHIPIVERVEDFMDMAKAGEELAQLHLNYEKARPWPGVTVSGAEYGDFTVDKMRFAGKAGAWDKSSIFYNGRITIGGIPEAAYEYIVNGRSAIEWIMESYRVRVDRDSGIRNDPNDWAKERGNPRYILDLLLSVIGLSMKTRELTAKIAAIPLPESGESGEWRRLA